MATFGPFTDNDRTAHQNSGATLHQSLLNKGFTQDDIDTALTTETPNSTVRETYEAEQWTQDRMDEAEDAIQELKEAGSLYAIHPSSFTGEVIGRPGSTDGGTFYFVNYSPRNGAQLHGWMSIEDLHKIAAGEITRDTLEDRDDEWRAWSEKEGTLSRHTDSGIVRIS